MWKNILETLKDVCKVIYNFIKSVVMFFSALGRGIYTFFKYIFAIIKGFFIFIKSVIDFFYKLVFMLFVCVVGFAIYKIYNNASDINRKLDEVKSSIQSILSFTNKSNELLNNINSLSIFGKDKQNDTVKDKNTNQTNKNRQGVGNENKKEDNLNSKNDGMKQEGKDRDATNETKVIVAHNQEQGIDEVKQGDNKNGIKQSLRDRWKKLKAWIKK